MSAWVCDVELFRRLAGFAAFVQPSRSSPNVDNDVIKGLANVAGMSSAPLELAKRYANILYRENLRSVAERYPNCKTVSDLPGGSCRPAFIPVHVSDLKDATADTVVQLLKDCDCLEYQSCETSDYKSTPAYALLSRIRCELIPCIAGYEEAPWG
jgi:hypothetical protein